MPWRMAAARIGSSRSTPNAVGGLEGDLENSRHDLGWACRPRRGRAVQRALNSTTDCALLIDLPDSRPCLALLPLRRPSLLIVGCGDVGLRVLRLLGGRWRVLALSSAPRVPVLAGRRRRAAGGQPGRAGHAGPPGRPGRPGAAPGAAAGPGRQRPAHAHLVQALARGGRVAAGLCQHQSGVYGDCAGRALRRDARRRARHRPRAAPRRCRRPACAGSAAVPAWPSASCASPASMPATARRPPARTPAARHAGAACRRRRVHQPHPRRRPGAGLRGRAAARLPQRVLHASDDTELRMGEYFDLAADLCGLPRPPRISRAEARRSGCRRCS
jgi:hypothetical protein